MRKVKGIVIRQFDRDQIVRDAARKQKSYGVLKNREIGESGGGTLSVEYNGLYVFRSRIARRS